MTHDPVQQALAELDSGDRSQRIEALRRLRAQTDGRIAPRLLVLLEDADSDVRRLSAEALGKNGGASSVRALSDTLYDDHPAVRAAAADALGIIGERAAVPALIDALYDENINVQFAAAMAIGLIADPRAVVDLIYLLDNADIPLAMMAAQALYKIGTPEALAAIQHLRDEDGTYHFRIPTPADGDDYLSDADERLRHISPDRLHDLVDEEALAETPGSASIPPAKEAETAPEPVQFSAYYPREVAPNDWHPLKAYVFKPGAANTVSADAAKELGARLPSYREVERPAQVSIAEGALITATPELAGFQFNPPSAQVAFYEDWQRFDFKLRAVGAAPEQASNGRITFTVEGVIVADIPLSVYVGEAGTPDDIQASATRPIYQSIFCSYSHRDTQIVERVERAYKALGMTFLRDVVTLKSGQDWDAELLKLIERADIFQLFWSKAASESKAVRKEWLHALSLKREDEAFIRPVYWEQPMPPPAPELAAIHFAFEPELDQA
ncbi:MAG: HEAT repeat domain-containing protein [Anaerolineae bacterium]|nr:HEAT repeat domain-containing protein [Anaerolineae bacterium]